VWIPNIDLGCGVVKEVEPVLLVTAKASLVSFDFTEEQTAVAGCGVVR
jgi:hypothetical protein